MDLYAYSQIGDLEHLLEENKIDIPRLRGLRLMSDEKIITDEETNERISEEQKEYAIGWLKQHCDWCWSSWKEHKRHKSFIYGKNERGERVVVDVDFSKVHGRDRKHIKHHWKMIAKRYISQYEVWNKYVGKNVLYVHARLGSSNWSDYKIDEKHPMFLERIDDAWDSSYCDIYYDLDMKGAAA